MPRARLTKALRLAAFAVCLFAVSAACDSYLDDLDPSTLHLSTAQIDEQLQECPFVQQLNADRRAVAPEASSLMKRVFGILFPAGPAVNSLLATAYISGPPNFVLALVPPDIDPASLSVMVAFAVGGLLGDTLLHLIPQTFLGEPHDADAHFVMLDANRNGVLGLFIFIGFATFVAMDKTLRILSGGGDAHGHSHGSSQEHVGAVTTGIQVNGDGDGEVKRRKGAKIETGADTGSGSEVQKTEKKEPNASIKMSSMLNLIADFSHNITDGLAMSAAFYAGPMIGATTCMAVVAHEIPHEVGDFALLVQGGFTKWQAMGAQFITAIGAFTGTLIGIAIQEYSASNSAASSSSSPGSGKDGLWGTDLSGGDLVLPFTAGTFLYVGFSVIPELLETGPDKAAEVKKTLKQFAAMALGFGIMFCISE